MRVFDMHCDTMTLINKKGLDLSNEQTAVSLPKAQLAKAEAYVQCFALFVKNDDSDEAEKEWAEHYEWFKNQMAKYSEKVEQAMTYDDILRITKAGKNGSHTDDGKCSSLWRQARSDFEDEGKRLPDFFAHLEW